jgi:hypothetical protein
VSVRCPLSLRLSCCCCCPMSGRSLASSSDGRSAANHRGPIPRCMADHARRRRPAAAACASASRSRSRRASHFWTDSRRYNCLRPIVIRGGPSRRACHRVSVRGCTRSSCASCSGGAGSRRSNTGFRHRIITPLALLAPDPGSRSTARSSFKRTKQLRADRRVSLLRFRRVEVARFCCSRLSPDGPNARPPDGSALAP